MSFDVSALAIKEGAWEARRRRAPILNEHEGGLLDALDQEGGNQNEFRFASRCWLCVLRHGKHDHGKRVRSSPVLTTSPTTPPGCKSSASPACEAYFMNQIAVNSINLDK